MPKLKKNIPCTACGEKKVITCPKCKGAGTVKSVYYNLTTVGDQEVEESCLLCDGSGKIPCPECSE